MLTGVRYRWGVRWVALLCATAVVVSGFHGVLPREDRSADAWPAVIADAATNAFAGTALASDATLDAQQRSAGIPAESVAGWDLPTADGRSVQLVLPGGLGSAEVTAGGQVVYPDRGAGFDVIAENQGTGGRTIARIAQPATKRAGDAPSLPIVPMFVRTPADTVMLAHTNGIITINQASPSAPTIATIAAPQARDSAGATIPSAFLTQQLRPGLYLLAQVIAPDGATAWPVYADPCFSCMLDSAVSGATRLADATVSGAKTVGTFVKNNPLESAQIVGGTLLIATGAGTGVGASLVFSGATGLVQKAAAADPTNTTLQALGDAMEVAGYISPARGVQKGLTNIAERGAQRVGDDLAANAAKSIGDAVKPKAVTPTPPTQLANDIAGAVAPKPGAGTPAAPNAPPAAAAGAPPTNTPPPAKLPYYEGPNGPRSLPKGCQLDCGHTTDVPVGVYDQSETPGHFNANLDTTARGKAPEVFDRVSSREAARNRYRAQKGHPRVGTGGNVLHEWSPASSAQGGEGADIHVLPKTESDVERDIFQSIYNRQGVKVGDQFSTAYRATDGNIRCVRCAIDHRETQRIQQAAADAARNRAQSVASGGNTDPGSRLTLQTQVSNNTQDTTSRTNRGKPKNKTGGTKKAAKKDKGEKKKPKKKKQSTNKKKRKGQR